MNNYGCQAVTIGGAVLGAACLVASMFATNVLTLYFTIGIGAGKVSFGDFGAKTNLILRTTTYITE